MLKDAPMKRVVLGGCIFSKGMGSGMIGGEEVAIAPRMVKTFRLAIFTWDLRISQCLCCPNVVKRREAVLGRALDIYI